MAKTKSQVMRLKDAEVHLIEFLRKEVDSRFLNAIKPVSAETNNSVSKTKKLISLLNAAYIIESSTDMMTYSNETQVHMAELVNLLKKGENVAINGDVASGKTTITRRLLEDLTSKKLLVIDNYSELDIVTDNMSRIDETSNVESIYRSVDRDNTIVIINELVSRFSWTCLLSAISMKLTILINTYEFSTNWRFGMLSHLSDTSSVLMVNKVVEGCSFYVANVDNNYGISSINRIFLDNMHLIDKLTDIVKCSIGHEIASELESEIAQITNDILVEAEQIALKFKKNEIDSKADSRYYCSPDGKYTSMFKIISCDILQYLIIYDISESILANMFPHYIQILHHLEDIRTFVDTQNDQSYSHLHEGISKICRRRGVELDMEKYLDALIFEMKTYYQFLLHNR